MNRHVTIVGGGITGLAAAYFLERAAAKGCAVRYTLAEAADRWGGKIITERRDGFIIEGGPDSFIAEKPDALALSRELGLSSQIIPSNPSHRRVYVALNGRLVPLPTGFRLTIPTRWIPFLTTPLFSWRGKLRMACEWFVPPRRASGDESLASFIRRRFGQECLDRLAGPLLGGIYVSDPESLSMEASFPRLLQMEREYGSLIRATRRALRSGRRTQEAPVKGDVAESDRKPREGRSKHPPPLFYSLRDGMSQLVETLRGELHGDLRPAFPIASIERRGKQLYVRPVHGDGWPSDAVVLAVPARCAATLLADSAPALSARLAELRAISTAVISFAYPRSAVPPQRPLDGYGVLIPPFEDPAFIAITWSSVKFEARAPADAVLLRVFAGGHRAELFAGAAEEVLISHARALLGRTMGITAPPLFWRIHRWIDANPQYEVGHLERVAALENLAKEIPGLYLAGSSYRGVGLPDCISSARRAVSALLDQTATGRPPAQMASPA